jgi:DNA-binding LytR/AlgR family response regulator
VPRTAQSLDKGIALSTSFSTTHQIPQRILTGIGDDPPQKQSQPGESRIAIKTTGRILFIDAADIVAVEAEGNYVMLHHKSSAHLLRESISTVEEKLSGRGFIRIHRSVLVNAAKVEEVRRLSTGEHSLRLRNGKEYTVTRTYRRNLRNVSPTCIGGEI